MTMIANGMSQKKIITSSFPGILCLSFHTKLWSRSSLKRDLQR